jgi:hypothetical protein
VFAVVGKFYLGSVMQDKRITKICKLNLSLGAESGTGLL